MASVNQVQALAWTIGQPSPAPSILDPRLIEFLTPRFNCRFLFQAQTLVDDGQGGKARGPWNSTLDVLGALEELTDIERLGGGAIVASSTHRILIAYLAAGIDPTMRVRYGTRIFEIHGVFDYSAQHLLLEVLVEEKFIKP